MGDELKNKFGAEVELKASDGGVFEVVVEGELLFSKKGLNRVPEDGEIEGLVQKSQK